MNNEGCKNMLKNIYGLNVHEIKKLLAKNEELNHLYILHVQNECEQTIINVLVESDIEHIDIEFGVFFHDYLTVALNGITKADCLSVLMSYYDKSMHYLMREQFDEHDNGYSQLMRDIRKCDECYTMPIDYFANFLENCLNDISELVFNELTELQDSCIWQVFLDSTEDLFNKYDYLYVDTDTYMVYDLQNVVAFNRGLE